MKEEETRSSSLRTALSQILLRETPLATKRDSKTPKYSPILTQEAPSAWIFFLKKEKKKETQNPPQPRDENEQAHVKYGMGLRHGLGLGTCPPGVDSGRVDLRVRVFGAGVFVALFGLPPLVPVDELRQVGCFLCIADYELVLQ